MRTNLFILIALVLLLTSCDKEIETLISVQLNPSFLSLSEGSNEPMKMKSAIADTVQVYAIQVYENDMPYYYGLFTDVSKMQIALTTSKTYKFKIVAYKPGTGKGLKTITDSEGVNYYLPTKLAVKNAFIKGDLLKDIDSPTTLSLNGLQKDFAEVDAFYATKSVTVEKGTTTIDFSLLRMGFGINFTVDALTSGNIEIYLGNDTIKLNSSKTTANTVRQFNKTTNNFTDIHSKADTFGDSIAISAKWLGSNGTTVTASGKYIFLRNYQKTINIQLNTTSNTFNFEGWASSTVTDIDGNVYKTVKIGNQIWMAENLKVTHYRDGSVIPNVTSNLSWGSLNTGAWCDYDNNNVNGNIYGHLYNWYAATDSKKIAPEGWHVPSNAEWILLENYLIANGFNYDGTKTGNRIAKSLASNKGWAFNSTIGAVGNTDFIEFQNRTGFNAIPSGHRKETTISNFFEIGNTTAFWSTTPYSSVTSWIIALRNYESFTDKIEFWNKAGFSIRCIKD